MSVCPAPVLFMCLVYFCSLMFLFVSVYLVCVLWLALFDFARLRFYLFLLVLHVCCVLLFVVLLFACDFICVC